MFLDAGLRLDGIAALDLWDLIVSVLGNTTQTTERPERPVITDTSLKSQGKTHVLNSIDCVPANFQSSHQEALLYVFEDNEAVIKMIFLEGVPQWDMFPGPTELRLIGCSIESTWTQKSKSSTLTPKTNLLTSKPKEIFHVMSGITCCACSTSANSVLQCALRQWRNDLNTIQRRTSHSKIATNDESYCNGAVARIILDFSKPGERSYGSQDPWISIAKKEERSGRRDFGIVPKKNFRPLLSWAILESFFSARYSKWNDNRAWSSSRVEIWYWDVRAIGETRLKLLGERHEKLDLNSRTRKPISTEPRNP